ncbi:MAG: tetratricopeptide repeat protein [Alphaproteobacteria bacterium]|nr:tetratricopeptide repeat protein [Alphaproteobacteria bacterium]
MAASLNLWNEALGHHLAQRPAEAEAAYRAAVSLDPGLRSGWSNLSHVCHRLGRGDEAITAAVIAAVLEPAIERLWIIPLMLGGFEEGARRLRFFAATRPGDADAALRLGVFLHRLERTAEARAAYETALERRPGHSETLCKLARAVDETGDPREAEGFYRRAEAAPDASAAPSYWLGLMLHGQGRLDDAVAAYERALDRDPAHHDAAVNAAVCQLNLDDVSPAEVLRSRRRWNARLPRPAGLAPARARPDPEAPLSIGFVSGDFRTHQVAFLTIRTIEGLRAATPARILCYANQTEDDRMTARFRAAAHQFRTIAGLDDATVASMMRADRLDVLIDMSGHFARNRLPLFTLRPAPLAAGWPCFTGTTGLSEMDALIADAVEIPPETEAFHSERVLRLPGCWITWDPPPWAPEIADRPPSAPPTFGSLSHPQKLNERTIALWAKLLRARGEARLLLRYAGLEQPETAGRLRAAFARHGVAEDRLLIEGAAPRDEFLHTYHHIDVALDPHPYSGGVTTLEALWMGVPVVTLPAATFPGRHAASILSSLGLDEWVARDEADWLAIAARLIADRDRLAGLRRGLRDRVAQSALCDGAAHGRHFHDLLAGRFAPDGRDYFQSGLRHHLADRRAEARADYRAGLALTPGDGRLIHNLGVLDSLDGRDGAAAALFDLAARVNPNNVMLHVNRALVFERLGRDDQSLAALLRVLALSPDRAPTWEQLGRFLWEKRRSTQQALDAFTIGARLQPHNAAMLANRSAMLRSADRLDEAIDDARRALVLHPTLVTALLALGSTLTMADRPLEGVPCFEMATWASPPGAMLARWNQSLAVLKAGMFHEGWRLYENRWEAPAFPSPRRSFAQSRWDGSPPDGRTILVHWEQGFGDTIQFSRYLALLRDRGARVVFECQKPLSRLMETLDGVDRLVQAGTPLPPFDAHLPLLSLPLLFDTTLETIPATIPYLRADPALVERFRGLVAPGPGRRIGLVWKGSGTHDNDRNRSLRLEWLAPLAALPGVVFHSLQKDAGDEAAAAGVELVDLAPHLDDFADTAAAMALMDLVITVDSAPAHLAGALGRPVWVLVPYCADFRWLIDREDSPWYPGMRLYRQPGPGGWPATLGRLEADLAAWLANNSIST